MPTAPASNRALTTPRLITKSQARAAASSGTCQRGCRDRPSGIAEPAIAPMTAGLAPVLGASPGMVGTAGGEQTVSPAPVLCVSGHAPRQQAGGDDRPGRAALRRRGQSDRREVEANDRQSVGGAGGAHAQTEMTNGVLCRPALLLPEGHPLRRHVLYRARLLQSQP